MLDPTIALTTHWGLDSADVSPLGGGMNSETWLVRHGGATYVAKSVAADGLPALVAGAEVATLLAEAGFVTGRPVPTLSGDLVAGTDGLALLDHVPGRELNGESEEEQLWIARTLAGVHAAGSPSTDRGARAFATDWLSLDQPGVTDHHWLVDAIRDVQRETDALALTWSVLHTDPLPGAFVHHDETGVTGLIDWAGARRGPVLYDVASAVMYLGGRGHASAFLRGYEADGPLGRDELAHLDAFSRFREAVQGAYFAARLATNDLTGGIERADNEKGLADARRRMAALGPAGS